MDAKSLMEILVEEGALNPLAVKIIDNMENANEAAISELNRKIMGLMAQVNDKEKIITALQKKVDGLDNQVHNLNNRDLYPEDFPPGPVSEETARYIGYREFIEAIRTYRTLTGLGLKDAKDWVEQMAPRLRIAGKEPQGKYSNPNSVYYFKVDEGMDT
jgi:ribosomal protein L7/L12